MENKELTVSIDFLYRMTRGMSYGAKGVIFELLKSYNGSIVLDSYAQKAEIKELNDKNVIEFDFAFDGFALEDVDGNPWTGGQAVKVRLKEVFINEINREYPDELFSSGYIVFREKDFNKKKVDQKEQEKLSFDKRNEPNISDNIYSSHYVPTISIIKEVKNTEKSDEKQEKKENSGKNAPRNRRTECSEAFRPVYNGFLKWFNGREWFTIHKIKVQLSPREVERLCSLYDHETIKRILVTMDNRKSSKNYISLYLAVLQWCKNESTFKKR